MGLALANVRHTSSKLAKNVSDDLILNKKLS